MINYDGVAPTYDLQPFRQKEADDYLLAFMVDSGREQPRVLDLACGTGSQLIANIQQGMAIRPVGVDLSWGMLKEAQAKMAGGHWLQAEAGRLPLAEASFDYVCNQFAYHHISNKRQMFSEVWRLLRPGGRFVLLNIQPQFMPGWLIYHYFPATWLIDQQRYLSQEMLLQMLAQLGFKKIREERTLLKPQQTAQHFRAAVYPRANASQLWAISDQDYWAGLARLEQDIAQSLTLQNEICLITIQADK